MFQINEYWKLFYSYVLNKNLLVRATCARCKCTKWKQKEFILTSDSENIPIFIIDDAQSKALTTVILVSIIAKQLKISSICQIGHKLYKEINIINLNLYPTCIRLIAVLFVVVIIAVRTFILSFQIIEARRNDLKKKNNLDWMSEKWIILLTFNKI